MTETDTARQRMVDTQIASRGVRDPRVLEAMRSVPRDAFVPDHLRDQAYDDTPLPIGHGQTISQPYIVAYMTEALELTGDDRVLEIGAGSGYAAAVLAEVAAEVFTVERVEELAEGAARTLRELGYENVEVIHADGSKGWPDAAPYDAIVAAAGAPEVPESLKRQLAVGGRLVLPVGGSTEMQRLVRVVRADEERFEREELVGVRFVPLVGEEGWDGDDGGRTGSGRLW